MPLTKRQREILNYLDAYAGQNGYAPSFEEIAEHFNYNSLATVHEHLSNLERKLNPHDFLRIHRSTIVNVHRIKEIHPWFHGYHVVLLENGQELRMSRYQDEVAKQLGIAWNRSS